MGAVARAVILGLLCLALGACSGGGGGGSGSGNTGAPSGASGRPAKVDVLALVLSADGMPVENALMGGGDAVSTSEGVVAGTVKLPRSGWVSISADGYATGYMKHRGEPLKGWYIFETYLTPIETAVIDTGRAARSLFAGRGTSAAVRLDLTPGDFSRPDVIVEMARLNPADVGPEFAPLSSGGGYYLNQALFVAARDAAGHDIALASGKTLHVTIRDGGRLGADFAFADFDAKGGRWTVRAGACRRPDADHIACTLDGGGTYGLFGHEPSAAVTGDSYRDVLHAYRRALGDWRRSAGKGGASDGSRPPPRVREAGVALVREARRYAGVHHGERGQMRLIGTAAQLRPLGMSDVRRDLVADARRYVHEAAGHLLGESPNCGRIRTLLDTAAKADLLGMDQERHDLIFKARNSYGACDVWAGTVHYTFFMEPQWPDDGGYHRREGPQIWSEEHRLKILVSPMSRKTSGTDQVATFMSPVTYERRFGNECGQGNTQRRDVYAEPAGGGFRLIFDGLYDYVHDKFQLSAFKLQGSQSSLPSIVLRQRSRIQRPSAAGCKQTASDTKKTLVKHYSSMLAGSFGAKSDLPTVQEMLNQGERRKLGNGRVVQGGRLIQVGGPPGRLPFSRARVSWHLINVPPTP